MEIHISINISNCTKDHIKKLFIDDFTRQLMNFNLKSNDAHFEGDHFIFSIDTYRDLCIPIFTGNYFNRKVWAHFFIM